MKSNPCRRCDKAFVYKNRHSPAYRDECFQCEKLIAHKQYLESQRMYEEGEPITDLEELLEQEFVMWYHTIRHIEVIKHVQLSTVLYWLDNGAFKKAVKKSVRFDGKERNYAVI